MSSSACLDWGGPRSQQTPQWFIELTPLGRAQRPEDLYGAITFLASRASDYVTGQTIVIDGGHTLSTWLTPLERSEPTRSRLQVWR